MPESAAGENRGKIGGHVRIRVTEVGPIQDHGAVQQGVVVLLHSFEPREQVIQEAHVPLVDRTQLRKFVLSLAMM